MFLSGLDKADLKLRQTVIANNGAHGLYVSTCRLVFDKSMIDSWLVRGHDHQITGSNSLLTFSDFTVKGGRRCGVRLPGGELRTSNSTFTGSAAGGSCFKLKKMVASDSQFTNNSLYGLQLHGSGALDRCTIARNRVAILLQGTDAADTVTVRGCTLKDNQEIGIYAVGDTMTFDADTLQGTTIAGSKIVYSGLRSQLTL